MLMIFASPLIRRDINVQTKVDKKFQIDLLDYQKEFEGAIDGLKTSKNEIQVKKICATMDNFTLALTENPIGIHFSGHGVKNNTNELGM